MASDRDILVTWLITYLPRLKKDGLITVPDNSPLSSEEIESALREVAEDDAYIAHTISVPNRDGVRTILRYVDGDIDISQLPFADEPHPRTMPDGTAVFMKEDSDDGE